jgi:hypothetical protein
LRVTLNTNRPGALRVYVVLEGPIRRMDQTTISIASIPRNFVNARIFDDKRVIDKRSVDLEGTRISARGFISASLDESIAFRLFPSRPSSPIGQSPTRSLEKRADVSNSRGNV